MHFPALYFTAGIAANAGAWGIPASEVSALQTANTAFATLQAKADSPAKTSIIAAEKNAARNTPETRIRELVGFRLKNPFITDAHCLPNSSTQWKISTTFASIRDRIFVC